MMTHPEVVNLIRGVRGNTLRLKVERGDHVVPNIQECFPIKTQDDYNEMTDEERLAYYQEACKRGLESRLIPPFLHLYRQDEGENPEVQLPHWYVQRDNYGRDGQRHFRPRRVETGPRGPCLPEDEELEEVRSQEEL